MLLILKLIASFFIKIYKIGYTTWHMRKKIVKLKIQYALKMKANSIKIIFKREMLLAESILNNWICETHWSIK